MNESTKKELIGLLPFNVDAIHEFVPAYFKLRDKDGMLFVSEVFHPLFKVRPLSRGDKNIVRRLLIDRATDSKAVEHSVLIEWARKHTVGWKNLIDLATMEEIEFKADPSGGADKELFGALPEQIISSVLSQIVGISGIFNAEKLGLGY